MRAPVLALPERVFEQQLNAWIVERMRVGRSSSFATVTADEIELFLAEALVGLRRFIDELLSLAQPANDLSRLSLWERPPRSGG